MLCYCKKCGRIVQFEEDEEFKCDYCSNKVLPIPDKYLDENLKIALKDGIKEQFIDECVKSSPEFDQYLFDHRDEELYRRKREMRDLLDNARASRIGGGGGPRCPICQSTNLSRLSSLGKATKVGLFGIFGAGDLGKTYKCNSCGSKF